MWQSKLLLSLCVVLTGGQAGMGQTLWSPDGCQSQCGFDDQVSTFGLYPVSGCWNRRDATYYQPWPPRPFGSSIEQILNVQRHNGIVAQFVFHHIDFSLDQVNGTWSLSQTGIRNVQKLARIWPNSPAKILIEPTGRLEWDYVRRDLAFQSLVASGVHCNIADLEIGSSPILGLVPADPENIYDRRQLPPPFSKIYGQSSQFGSGQGTDNAANSGGGTTLSPRN